MKHLFIVNPAAGKGMSLKLIPIIEKVFLERHDRYIIKITERPDHATEIVRDYVSREDFRVYSVGGDGTLNEVLNGLAGSNSSLAVIPCGSGNDFIKSILDYSDVGEILRKTINGYEELIDLGRVNERYFINISSAGFDAEVVWNARRLKKIPGINGSIAYILGIFLTVARLRHYPVKISIDDQTYESSTLLTVVANGRYYGGGMLPAPEARLNDGKLDICIIKGLSRLKILMFFPKLIKGRHGTMKEVTFYKGSRIQIVSKNDIPVNMDGEVTRLKELNFEILPKALKIVIPEGMDISGRISAEMESMPV